MEVYVTPVLAVPEWARKASFLLVVASLAPAGPLSAKVREVFMDGANPVDHPVWALAYTAMAMRDGKSWNLCVHDLIFAGVGIHAIPCEEEVEPYLGPVV